MLKKIPTRDSDKVFREENAELFGPLPNSPHSAQVGQSTELEHL